MDDKVSYLKTVHLTKDHCALPSRFSVPQLYVLGQIAYLSHASVSLTIKQTVKYILFYKAADEQSLACTF